MLREQKQHLIEAYVGGVCFRGNDVLLAKRSPARRLYPSLWECGGGQVEAGENFEEAVVRQLREELEVIVKPLGVFGVYEISTPNLEQTKIPDVKFACEFVRYVNGDQPHVSEEHTDWRWQSVDNLEGFEFIPGVDQDIQNAFQMMSYLKK